MMKTKQMKILHIAQAPGGVERYLYMLLKGMNHDIYQNILICSKDYNTKKFEPFVESLECIEMYREINLIKDLKCILRLRKKIKEYQPDIIYLHSSKAGAVGRIANIGLNTICVYNAHGWAFNMKCGKVRRQIFVLIEKILANFCEKIIAISDYEKTTALRYKICSDKKIKVIFNGIDIKEYKKNNTEKNILYVPKNAYVIGYVGRLTEQKAPDIFVKAAKIIKEEIPNAFFIMVGDGNQKTEIEELIHQLNLADCFKITGWVDSPMEYIKCFDVAMLLSRWEGFGLVLPEFMIAEKPIIATNVDAIANIIKDGENGLLIKSNEYRKAAQLVVRIHTDESLKNHLIKNASECVRKYYDIDRVVEEHDAIFRLLYSNR